MKKSLLFLTVLVFSKFYSQVHTTYLWHMHQPTYWGEKSKADPNRYQMVKESQDLKVSGQNTYSDGLAHPLNDLQEIFSLPDRVNAYQFQPKNAVQSILGYAKAGAQITYGGSLIENINSLAIANQWGYSPSWKNSINTAHSWQTLGGKPRLDLMGFTMHHTLSPLASDEVLKKEIQAHRYYQTQQFGYYSPGYWPAECSFSENIIKVLKEENFDWTIVSNSHLARTLSDYPLVFGTNGCNIDPPNKADKVATTGVNWHNGQIDGRGGQFAAPYCFTPHKAQYIDPENGTEYKITVVPMADLDSYRDGFSQQGTTNIDTNIAPFSGSRPPLVLLAHDGDNAWGGGSSYYSEAVPGFTNAAASKGYVPTTIQQYLSDFPVPDTDVVHVEDGSWFNAANDWGSPQYINWFWPLTQSSDKSKFDPNGWTEDVRNQAVLFAGDNFCKMAEELNGGVNIADVVAPGASSPDAAKAWHFLLPGYDSGNAYYGTALDLEIKATLAANRAISFAQNTINAYPNTDSTKPSVLIPQRYPYNPGEIGFGPNYGYQQKLNSADFSIWTLAFDVSGIQSAVLKYRIDTDGTNNPNSNHNETYAGGSEVGTWITVNMNKRIMPKDNVTNNPEVSFFMLPDYIADLYWADVNGISEKLLDYYVEVTDNKGNVTKTKIQHVWVGKNLNVNPVINFNPTNNYSANPIDVIISATDNTDPHPVIYYTTDGSTPTTSSASAVGTITINITQTTTFKAFAKDADGNTSDVETKTYYIGSAPNFTVYFKPPSSWNGVVPKIHYWNSQPAGALPPTTWPGVSMTESCDGWYSYSFTGITSTNVIFNNGNSGVGTNQTADLTVNSTSYYDWTSGWLSTPPSITNPCLSISPKGGTFGIGTSVPVVIKATDATDANPKIYYTTDGSSPTESSPNFISSGTVNISTDTTLKAFAKNNSGNSSEIKTEVYNFINSGITVHFKPTPSANGWTGVTPKVYYWNVVGGSIPPTTWPGVLMVSEGNGWYKYSFPGVTSLNVIFNNGSGGVGTNQTPDIINVTQDIWYNWETQSMSTINQNIDAGKIILYPNPVSDILYLKSQKPIKKYAIYDGSGNLVKQEDFNKKMIDVHYLVSGMYYLKLLTEENKIIFEQFIKK